MNNSSQAPRILCASFSHWPFQTDDPEALLFSMLPNYCFQQDMDIRVIVPAYPIVKAQLDDLQVVSTLHLIGTTEPLQLLLGRTKLDMPIYLLELPGISQADLCTGKSPEAVHNYALFCRAVVNLATDGANLAWRATVVHHNNWQTGLVSALLNSESDIKTVFTLPDGNELGFVDDRSYRSMYLSQDLLTEEGVLWDGRLSFLKAAIRFSDELVLRSHGLAGEIANTPNQVKLNSLLESRAGHTRSIKHGINHDLWNPATDQHTVQQYDAASIQLKKVNKLRLQQTLEQEENNSVLVLGFCGPLSEQSGLAQILNILPDLVHEENVKLIIQAWGDNDSEEHLRNQQATYPDLLTVLLGENESLYHQIIAGADCLILPSIFPTSGEHATVAMTYGTVPIATSAGAHKDYIVDTNSRTSLNGTASGFLYPVDRPSALLDTIRRVKSFYTKPGVWWEKLAANCMDHPYTGDRTIEAYRQLYTEL